MSYTAWSVTAGEVPTSTKWNILGTNDAGFNDGTNIAAGAIVTASLAAGAVDATKLSSAAIYAGQASSTTLFSTSSTSVVQITGLTKSVTVPSGGRSVLILFNNNDMYNTGSGTIAVEVTFWKGTVGTGTQLQMIRPQQVSSGQASICSGFALDVNPGAGTYTYNMGIRTTSGANAANLDGASTTPQQMVCLIV